MQKSHYRPEIDGLRALAVSAVVLFHVGYGMPGGFVGVDVFFVISGFLITGIIRTGLEKNTFSLLDFWERRVRRIFPAVIIMVLATSVAGYWLLLPHELEELGESCVAQALMLANFYFWGDTGYFTGPAELKPLLHTWSLAVEEQFYLFFPFLLVFFKKLSRKQLFWLLAMISAISLGASIYGTKFHPVATFYLLPTRAWELLVGCMLALFPWKHHSAPRRDVAIAIAGLLAIVLPVFLYDYHTLFPGLAAIPPVVGTAAIIYATAATRGTLVERLFSLRPVVFIGLISYSLYLWHWPVIVFVKAYYGQFEWEQAALAFVLSILLAILSWRFIETPCRRTTFLPRRRRLFGTAFLLSGFAVAVSLLFVVMGKNAKHSSDYSVLLEDVTWRGEFGITLEENFDFETLPVLGVPQKNRDHGERPDFVLWGDSHGMVLAPLISDVATELGLSGRGVLTGGQVPLPGVRFPENAVSSNVELRFREELLEYLKVKRPLNLILVSCWSWHTDGYLDVQLKANKSRKITDHLHTNQPFGIATPEGNMQVLTQGLKELVAFCDEYGVKLWVVKQVPVIGGVTPAKDVLLWSIGRRKQLPDFRTSLAQHRLRQTNPEKMFSAIPAGHMRLLDPAAYFFDDEQMTIIVHNGRSNYRDADHLTRHGVERLRELMTGMLLEIKQAKERD